MRDCLITAAPDLLQAAVSAHIPPTRFTPCRLLGAGVDFGQQTDWGRWRPELALDPQGERPWLFVAQQKRLSNREMGIYEDHVAAAGEVDEETPLDFS